MYIVYIIYIIQICDNDYFVIYIDATDRAKKQKEIKVKVRKRGRQRVGLLFSKHPVSVPRHGVCDNNYFMLMKCCCLCVCLLFVCVFVCFLFSLP